MNVLGVLESGLFALAQVLRLPVMVALWVCVIVVVFHIGQSIAVRFKGAAAAKRFDVKGWVNAGCVLGADATRVALLPSSLRSFVASAQQQLTNGTLQHGGLENVLAEHEEVARHRLDVPRALVKVAPSLGLLGTLIPMGASLAAMSGGDLNAMAAHMVVAFTTTIIGIAVGTLAYLVVATQQGALNVSVRQMRYLAEVISSELERS